MERKHLACNKLIPNLDKQLNPPGTGSPELMIRGLYVSYLH